MSNLYSFVDPDRCVIGTVGTPGARAFYLQVTEKSRITTVALEKTQAAALSERMRAMVRDISRRNQITIEIANRDDGLLQSPIDSDFQAGDMSVLWLADKQKVQIEIQELDIQDREDPKLSEGASNSKDRAMLRVQISLSYTSEFVRRTEAIVNSGRQPCMFCGLPINPDGHLCPRANGYRR